MCNSQFDYQFMRKLLLLLLPILMLLSCYVMGEDKGEMQFVSKAIEVGKVYPNPVKDVANINYRIIEDTKIYKVVIRNLIGNTVGSYKLDPHKDNIHIDLSHLPSGVYFYSIKKAEQNIYTRKFLVK